MYNHIMLRDIFFKVKRLIFANPHPSLRFTAREFNRLNGKMIVEIGTMRPSKFGIQDQGFSTMVWAKYTKAKEIYSIDLDNDLINYAKKKLENFPAVKLVNADGIDFLLNFEGTIDLLYLDACDVGVPNYKEIHLQMYVNARTKLAKQSLILIDDTDLDNKGKGELVINEAVKDGYRIVYSNRQTLLIRE